jgi:uncharacterized Zn finger protein (UPF0148 family)
MRAREGDEPMSETKPGEHVCQYCRVPLKPVKAKGELKCPVCNVAYVLAADGQVALKPIADPDELMQRIHKNPARD